MSELKPNGDRCVHGVGFARLPSGKPPYCAECDLIWHEMCLKTSKASVEHHQRKRDEALAAISRTCGDA
jgi:hypothetical protein